MKFLHKINYIEMFHPLQIYHPVNAPNGLLQYILVWVEEGSIKSVVAYVSLMNTGFLPKFLFLQKNCLLGIHHFDGWWDDECNHGATMSDRLSHTYGPPQLVWLTLGKGSLCGWTTCRVSSRYPKCLNLSVSIFFTYEDNKICLSHGTYEY